MSNIVLEKLLTIDETGVVKAPTIRQLQDKDVLMLWSRDNSKNKTRYISEAGVIYYLGDPKSPAKQQGLSDDEALKAAIENYGLPKDYKPDKLVSKLIEKYYKNNITEAGVALEVLQQSIHLVSVAAKRINEELSRRLAEELDNDSISAILTLIDAVNKRITDIPNLTKSLNTAMENLRNEEEQSFARGGVEILSSMNADEEF